MTKKHSAPSAPEVVSKKTASGKIVDVAGDIHTDIIKKNNIRVE